MTRLGKLYGLGIGPGDPELLTLKAINCLKQADIILTAASPRNDYSVALSIASSHLMPKAIVHRLDFPMTRDQATREQAWQNNAKVTADFLHQSKNVAFLTLGDPLIYSTFGYLLAKLNILLPELEIEIVPGITSFQSAAAKTKTILCEDEETLTIFPGIAPDQELDRQLSHGNNLVILKTYRNINEIRRTIATHKRGRTVFVSRLHMQDEFITDKLSDIPESPSYLSLIISRQES